MTSKRARVCVVEDDPFIALDTSMTLEELGFEVAGPFFTLQSGLKSCSACSFDCALLDVNLGGGETSEEIARVLRKREIPFAFVTAYDPAAVVFRTADETCVTKPMSKSALRSIVEQLLA